MPDAEQEPAVAPHVAHVVDGNAIAGVLRSFASADPTSVIIECGSCHGHAALAEWIVEADRSAFIVRCRSCTRTMGTIMRGDTNLTIRIAGGPVLTVPRS